MKKSTLCALTLAAMPSFASADTIFGLYLGAGSWQSEFSGDFNTLTDGDIDIENDLGLSDDSTNILWVALEHPIPLVPNIKVRSTGLKIDDSKTLTQGITFSSSAIPTGTNVTTNLDLSHNDAILYYEILDNWISIDVGFTVRQFDGEVEVAGAPSITIDETIPLLYAMGQFDLPFSGFYAGFEANAIGFNDSGVTDLTVKLGYESGLRLGAELGFRTFNITLDEVNTLSSDIDISGIYAAITFHL